MLSSSDPAFRKSHFLDILDLILAQKDKIKIVSDLAFEAVDNNHSGSLSKEELGNELKIVAGEMGVTPPNEADIKAVIDELDEDGDGDVSKDEFEHLIC